MNVVFDCGSCGQYAILCRGSAAEVPRKGLKVLAWCSTDLFAALSRTLHLQVLEFDSGRLCLQPSWSHREMRFIGIPRKSWRLPKLAEVSFCFRPASLTLLFTSLAQANLSSRRVIVAPSFKILLHRYTMHGSDYVRLVEGYLSMSDDVRRRVIELGFAAHVSLVAKLFPS
jgi:hypothetical protein